MFFPSDKAIDLLTNALHALAGWRELLRKYGLYDSGKLEAYYDNLELGVSNPEDFDRWGSIREELLVARSNSPEQLRELCSDLLRNREIHVSQAREPGLLDQIAQLEVKLGEDGFPFDGFSVKSPEARSQLLDRIDGAMKAFLESPSGIPFSANVPEKISTAEKRLLEGNFSECLTNLRLALKFALEEAAGHVASREGITSVPSKEEEVRRFLRDKSFFTEEEYRGYWGIYGLLSSGPHGSPGEEITLLGFATSLIALHYLSEKLKPSRP